MLAIFIIIFTTSISYANVNDSDSKSNIISTTNTNTITKESTTTIISNKNVYQGRNVSLDAKVTSKNSLNVIKDSDVTFKVNNKSVGTSRVENGVSSFILNTSKYSIGTYNITAVFNGNTPLASSTSNMGRLNILKHEANIKVENVNVNYSNNALLKATIVDRTNNTYITSGKVAFKINGITVGYSNIKNGKASYFYNTSNLSAKKYNITVVYSGSTNVNSFKSNGTLSVQHMNTILTMNNINSKTNTSTAITVNVRDANNNKVKTGYITFKVGSDVIGNASVTDGVARINYSTPNIVKNYTVSAVYVANNRYATSSKSAKLSVSLKVNLLKWGSVGNIKKNSVLYNNLTKSSITEELVSAALSGTPYVCLGEGKGKTVVIVAGIHGNELSSQSAAIKLINDYATKEIHGSVYVFPFVAPSYTGNNTRSLGGVNLNNVANKAGTISNRVYLFAKSVNAVSLGDFHCTRPGGKPGKNAVFGTYNPLSSSAALAKYIASKTSSSSIIYTTAGTEYPGALEDHCNLNGLTSVTCEVKTAHGTVASGSMEKSYNMMKSYLNYYNLL